MLQKQSIETASNGTIQVHTLDIAQCLTLCTHFMMWLSSSRRVVMYSSDGGQGCGQVATVAMYTGL